MSYLAGGGCGATACSAMLPTVLRVMLLRPETGIQIPYTLKILCFVERPDPKDLSTFSQCTEFTSYRDSN